MKSERSGQLGWFKSTYSGGDGGECVEIAVGGTAIHIRDSKDRGGPGLAVPRDVWAGFVADVTRRRAN